MVVHLLGRAYVASQACVKATLPGERHPSELAVLTAVEAFGPASQRVLGERLAINRTVMVQLVDRLEREGLVVRNRDPHDRRSYALVLSDKGRAELKRLDTAADAHTACLTHNLTASQRRRLNRSLSALLATPAAGLTDLPPKLTERTGFLVARAHFMLRDLGTEALAPLGIEPRHVAALALLDDLGPVSQQRLAQELGVSGTIVVQLADHLEVEGLVERRRDPDDRRVYRLTLTPEGVQVLAEARRILEEVTVPTDLAELLVALLGPEQRERGS